MTGSAKTSSSASSAGSFFTYPCCEGVELPGTLFASLQSFGVDIELTKQGNGYSGEAEMCGGTVSLTFVCQEDPFGDQSWHLIQGNGNFEFGGSGQCDPLIWTFDDVPLANDEGDPCGNTNVLITL